LWPDNGVGRNDDWTNDPAISLTQQSGLDNAGTVGYSKGHLVASEYRQTTVKQNKQTFYYSNQAPQWQNGFNDGIWNALENRVKAKAPTGSTMMYVVTGVLYEYDGSLTTLKSGSLNVPIPTHFYKCIMQCTFNGTTITGAKGIAFVYTNQSHSNTTYYGTDGSESFVTSIDAIEERAGFDFFSHVPASYQSTAEKNKDHSWFTGVSNLSSISDNNWGTL
jgi:DNA/RNA endonuclease G (NUC1)